MAGKGVGVQDRLAKAGLAVGVIEVIGGGVDHENRGDDGQGVAGACDAADEAVITLVPAERVVARPLRRRSSPPMALPTPRSRAW